MHFKKIFLFKAQIFNLVLLFYGSTTRFCARDLSSQTTFPHLSFQHPYHLPVKFNANIFSECRRYLSQYYIEVCRYMAVCLCVKMPVK